METELPITKMVVTMSEKRLNTQPYQKQQSPYLSWSMDAIEERES